jgi:hypothetical protein
MEPLSFYVHRVLNELKTKRLLMECCEDLESDNAKREQTTEQTEKPKRDPEQEREYIEERLRKIREFERSYERKSR